MIVPSIDIRDGRAVQLRRGREFVLDGGDPLERLEEFSIAGEVAIVDLDAALGTGSNRDIIRAMVGRHPCRVGGGIRSAESAMDWLDAGARSVVIGTAAVPEVLRQLPRERVIAAVDADSGEVVVEGWQKNTGAPVLEKIRELSPYVGGFLLTQVEYEGGMAGFDLDLVRSAVQAAGDVRLTAAGGITSAAEIAELDELGVDAQLGMALYSGSITVGDAFAAALRKPLPGGIWPTIVEDAGGGTLGLVWSTRETLAEAVNTGRGVYWSRSRGRRWLKGETSGNTQRLTSASLDCDRDAIRFVVEQEGTGFCHAGTRTCFGTGFDLGALEGTIEKRRTASDPNSGTVKLFADESLLGEKLREEVEELLAAEGSAEVTHEAADVIYFTLVRMAAAGVSLRSVIDELARRNRRVTRRPMREKRARS